MLAALLGVDDSEGYGTLEKEFQSTLVTINDIKGTWHHGTTGCCARSKSGDNRPRT
jgi:hypothetical protein